MLPHKHQKALGVHADPTRPDNLALGHHSYLLKVTVLQIPNHILGRAEAKQTQISSSFTLWVWEARLEQQLYNS